MTSLQYIEGILPKGPYLPCASMVGRALVAGYPRYIILWCNYNIITLCVLWEFPLTVATHRSHQSHSQTQQIERGRHCDSVCEYVTGMNCQSYGAKNGMRVVHVDEFDYDNHRSNLYRHTIRKYWSTCRKTTAVVVTGKFHWYICRDLEKTIKINTVQMGKLAVFLCMNMNSFEQFTP